MNPLSMVFSAFAGTLHAYMWKNIGTDYLGHLRGDRLFFGGMNKTPDHKTPDHKTFDK